MKGVPWPKAMVPATSDRGNGGAADVAEAVGGAGAARRSSGRPKSQCRRAGQRIAMTSLFPRAMGAARAQPGQPEPTTVPSDRRDPKEAGVTAVPGGVDELAVQAMNRRPRPRLRDQRRELGGGGNVAATRMNLARAANVDHAPIFPPYRAASMKTTRDLNSSGWKRRHGTGHPVRDTMTPTMFSKRAASARCLMCRVGLKRSES